MKRLHLRKWLLAGTVLTAGLAAAFLLLRGPLLERALEEVKEKFSSRWQADLQVKGLHWEGLDRIAAPAVLLRRGPDTLLYARGLRASLRLHAFLTGGPVVSRIEWSAARGCLRTGGTSQRWTAEGWLKPATRAFSIAVTLDTRPASAPGPDVRGLRLHLRSAPPDDHGQTLRLRSSAFTAHASALARDTLAFHPAEARLVLRRSGDTLALAPASMVRVRGLEVAPRAHYALLSRRLEIGLSQGELPLSALLDALPAGLCPGLEGLEVSGKYRADFRLGLRDGDPHTLRFRPEVRHGPLTVRRFGKADLRCLRDLHAATSGTPPGALPRHFVRALLLSEDAGFYRHSGFDTAIIRRALIDNLVAGKFVRGAGTIPMQLVRNALLSREKTAGRKLEEALLTWLMAEGDYLSRDEQLALYLHLIEWGPGIYGIDAAAQFYFGKNPARLTLDESLFLCAIVPNPRYFSRLLEPDGRLTPFAAGYWDAMRWQLAEDEVVPETVLDAPYPAFPALARRPAEAASANLLY